MKYTDSKLAQEFLTKTNQNPNFNVIANLPKERDTEVPEEEIEDCLVTNLGNYELAHGGKVHGLAFAVKGNGDCYVTMRVFENKYSTGIIESGNSVWDFFGSAKGPYILFVENRKGYFRAISKS